MDELVAEVELFNALDEPLGTVVQMLHSVDGARSTLFPDVVLPEQVREVRRHDYTQIAEFEPLSAPDRFRVRYAFNMALEGKTGYLISSAPLFMLDPVAKRELTSWFVDFNNFHHKMIADILKREEKACSAHAEFYAASRTCLDNMLGTWTNRIQAIASNNEIGNEQDRIRVSSNGSVDTEYNDAEEAETNLSPVTTKLGMSRTAFAFLRTVV
eukprot:gnl/TRDRNA2_/TRDRNA2_152177_c0_seq1.p1 gnl/TRDRNA2_/TRDRNA2_152177_c0~~gnl/TRDRNA2_/TRDRNA2_152177_c0_seq1.p1  ORF type:complete len:220 (-),score=33.79 gnl/TRDRNA2_/TRDRNA2_152177_c0_seq1:131-769(-)